MVVGVSVSYAKPVAFYWKIASYLEKSHFDTKKLTTEIATEIRFYSELHNVYCMMSSALSSKAFIVTKMSTSCTMHIHPLILRQKRLCQNLQFHSNVFHGLYSTSGNLFNPVGKPPTIFWNLDFLQNKFIRIDFLRIDFLKSDFLRIYFLRRNFIKLDFLRSYFLKIIFLRFDFLR